MSDLWVQLGTIRRSTKIFQLDTGRVSSQNRSADNDGTTRDKNAILYNKMATRRRPTSSSGASTREATATDDNGRRRAAALGGASARLSPRPAPRPNAEGDGVVVVVAQEALASAAAQWQDRSEHEAEANARLRLRVVELEAALRKAQTEVKRRRELPNNEVFTKGLVEENHALVKRNRALLARLAHYQGRGLDAVPHDVTTRSAEHKPRRSSVPHAVASNAVTDQQVQTDPLPQQVEKPGDVSGAQASMAAVRPLVEALKKKLEALETDLARLHQENELLRAELDRSVATNERSQARSPSGEPEGDQPSQTKERIDLHSRMAAQSNLVKILEVRYQHLHEKAEQQANLYQESLTIQKDLNAKLLGAQLQIGDQQQRLAQYSDEHALVEDLRKEVRILRTENATLNEAILTLSSRPFESLSKELQKKNLLIAELEERKSKLEQEKARAKRESRAAQSVTEQVRGRIKELEAEIQALMLKFNDQRLECQRVQMESEIAQLQLRFYTAPPDKKLLVALGQAVREMKKQERDVADMIGSVKVVQLNARVDGAKAGESKAEEKTAAGAQVIGSKAQFISAKGE